MGSTPRTVFVQRGDGAIAYQSFGSGPAVLQIVGSPTHCEHMWQFPQLTQNLERLAHFVRLLVYDMRGVGMSDRLPEAGYGVEEMAADTLAVLDASGVERAAVLASITGGPVAIWLAVYHPERVMSLLLDNTYAGLRAVPGHEVGASDEMLEQLREVGVSRWGTGSSMTNWVPSSQQDERLQQEWARIEMVTATPRALGTFSAAALALDARDLLTQVTQPTLVTHARRNGLVPVVLGRDLAERIPGARYIECGSSVVEQWGDAAFRADVVEFLTGARPTESIERMLGVVLFVDIAGSTTRASNVGDNAWADLLVAFRRRVSTVLARFGARQINTRGDDVLIVTETPSVAIDVAHAIRADAEGLGVEVRSGAHLGEIERMDDDVAGITVHIGARIADLAVAGEILVSRTVRDAMIGSPVTFTSRGVQPLKGVPGNWEILLAEDV